MQFTHFDGFDRLVEGGNPYSLTFESQVASRGWRFRRLISKGKKSGIAINNQKQISSSRTVSTIEINIDSAIFLPLEQSPQRVGEPPSPGRHRSPEKPG
ncbi:MAG: hypothetical protein DMG06_21090 [Acidobacteria bacterium]|nr:MAG: hypothetical protein DMG06_21090 [Acidobacteriota bacterium]